MTFDMREIRLPSYNKLIGQPNKIIIPDFMENRLEEYLDEIYITIIDSFLEMFLEIEQDKSHLLFIKRIMKLEL